MVYKLDKSYIINSLISQYELKYLKSSIINTIFDHNRNYKYLKLDYMLNSTILFAMDISSSLIP